MTTIDEQAALYAAASVWAGAENVVPETFSRYEPASQRLEGQLDVLSVLSPQTSRGDLLEAIRHHKRDIDAGNHAHDLAEAGIAGVYDLRGRSSWEPSSILSEKSDIA